MGVKVFSESLLHITSAILNFIILRPLGHL